MREAWFEGVGLGVRLWEGVYEGKQALWLRWCERDGQLIPTGLEAKEQKRQRAEQESEARRLAEARVAQEVATRAALEAELAQLRAQLARLQGAEQ